MSSWARKNANSEGALHSYVTPAEGAPRGVGVILMHLYAAFVHRDAFFERKFGAVFEHAKTLARGVGVIFDAPLRGIGTPECVFLTKFRSGF